MAEAESAFTSEPWCAADVSLIVVKTPLLGDRKFNVDDDEDLEEDEICLSVEDVRGKPMLFHTDGHVQSILRPFHLEEVIGSVIAPVTLMSSNVKGWMIICSETPNPEVRDPNGISIFLGIQLMGNFVHVPAEMLLLDSS